MRLFVLGNGFDKAHGLPTGYDDFRDYLEIHNPGFLIEFEKIHNHYPVEEERLSPVALEKRKNSIKETLWQNFELNLSKFDMETILDESESLRDLMERDVGDVGVKDTMDAHWNDNYEFLCQIDELMLQWVESISLSQTKTLRVFDENDLFLTFNYTKVIEKVYNIPESQVLHIHGSIDSESIVIGHNDNAVTEKMLSCVKKSQERFDEFDESVYEFIYKIQKKYVKDTQRYISQNWYFFAKLKDVDEICVIGHSFGEVDWPYFEVIRKISKDAKWNVYYFHESDKNAFYGLNKKLRIPKVKLSLMESKSFWII